MKVKGTGCLLEECVKDNYYARFHPHSYHCCKVMKFIPRLDANCGRTDGRTDERTNGRKVEPLYRTLLKAGAIKRTMNSISTCIWTFYGDLLLQISQKNILLVKINYFTGYFESRGVEGR